MMNINYKIVETEEELNQAFNLRVEVFVDEQKVPKELELDELDNTAMHVIALFNNEVIGCGRIVYEGNDAIIGRVAVKKILRNKSIGKQLMLKMIETAVNKNAKTISLHAQVQVVPFYEKLGFKKEGEIFLDAGIEHINMIYTPINNQ